MAQCSSVQPSEEPVLDDEVVMYAVKVEECKKTFPHDYTTCPWLHPGERARRRNPRTCQYSSTLCPDVKKDKVCARGLNCPYSHNIWEYFLHPDRYRTRMCDFGDKCTRKLCFFAHNAEQLRVTAKSLAAQQAQASSGKAKPKQHKQGGGGGVNSGSNSHSSSANDLQASGLDSSSSPPAGSALQPSESSAGAELMRQLERLSVEDPAAAATIMGLLCRLDIHPSCLPVARKGSSASSDSLSATAATDDQGTGGSPRTPDAYATHLPAAAAAAAAAAQRKGAAAMGCLATGSSGQGGARGTTQSSAGRLSVQEHIAAVMSGKQVPSQPPARDTASQPAGRRGLASPAGRSPGFQGAGGLGALGGSPGLAVLHAGHPASLRPPPPLDVFGMPSPAANQASGGFLPGQGLTVDLLAATTQQQQGVPPGQLCSPQFVPAVASPSMGSGVLGSPGWPAPPPLEAGPLAGAPAACYGPNTQPGPVFSGALPGLNNAMGCAGLLPMMGPDSGHGQLSPLDTFAPVLMQQQPADAALGRSLSSPLVGSPQLLPCMSPSDQAAAAAAAAVAQAQLQQQQQQLLLLQQQQAAASAAPVFSGWGPNARGVGSMLGTAGAAGFGNSPPGMVPCVTGCLSI